MRADEGHIQTVKLTSLHRKKTIGRYHFSCEDCKTTPFLFSFNWTKFSGRTYLIRHAMCSTPFDNPLSVEKKLNKMQEILSCQHNMRDGNLVLTREGFPARMQCFFIRSSLLGDYHVDMTGVLSLLGGDPCGGEQEDKYGPRRRLMQ